VLSELTELRYDRQVRAFGPELQDRLARLTIAVVGVGGVGSLVVQGLACLGAGRLLLVDPDTVEPSNLNRLVGATPADAARGTAKVDVAARAVAAINPATAVSPVRGSVTEAGTWSHLRAAEVIVGAVDGHAARWALNRLAVQYARCYLDVGVDLRPMDEGVGGRLEAGGHLAVLRPQGRACCACRATTRGRWGWNSIPRWPPRGAPPATGWTTRTRQRRAWCSSTRSWPDTPWPSWSTC